MSARRLSLPLVELQVMHEALREPLAGGLLVTLPDCKRFHSSGHRHLRLPY